MSLYSGIRSFWRSREPVSGTGGEGGSGRQEDYLSSAKKIRIFCEGLRSKIKGGLDAGQKDRCLPAALLRSCDPGLNIALLSKRATWIRKIFRNTGDSAKAGGV